MITTRPAAVLFDMDGLLLDSERLIRDVMIAVMADMGLAMTTGEFAALIGLPEAASRLWMQDRFAGLDYAVMRAAVAARITAQWGPRRPLKPGAAELLAQVRAAGIPAMLVTSTAQRQAHSHLHHAGLRDHFVGIVGGEMWPMANRIPSHISQRLQSLAWRRPIAWRWRTATMA
jgi:beta-phosphoglucomutase-like phosphatase (HAD superfamily)